MFFHRKIYLSNKPLLLTNDAPKLREEQPISVGYLKLEGAFRRNFKLAVQHLANPRSLGAIIEDISETALLETLHDLYEPIDAGGGVVQNEKGEVLMIYRRGKWDLPKGKADNGESMAQCAVREVEEETGARSILLGNEICKTYHVYAQNGHNYLKRTSWYHMTASSSVPLCPQAQENILQAAWMPRKQLYGLMLKSYDAVKETLLQAGVL